MAEVPVRRGRPRSGVAVRWTLAALALLSSVLMGASPASADAASTARARQIASALALDPVYVEAQEVGGDAELWQGRLTTALAAVESPEPVRVGFWVASDEGPYPRDLTRDGLGRGVLLTTTYDQFDVVTTGRVAGRVAYAADQRRQEAEAVLDEALRLSGRPADATAVLPVAEAWAWLLLAAPNPPTEAQLAARLARDPEVFTDSDQVAQPGLSDDIDFVSSSFLVVIGVMVAGFVAVRVVMLARGSSGAHVRGHAGPAPGPMADEPVAPAPSRIEVLVTDLGVAISEADARPGTVTYDRAQSCLDAAERYVDRDADRDRLGVQLLVEDGQAWLTGRRPPDRCWFNPRHDARDRVVREATTVPCCRRCRDDVRAGREPAALRIGGRPYFAVDDIWTRTGYGSLSQDWAEQVYRDALDGRR